MQLNSYMHLIRNIFGLNSIIGPINCLAITGVNFILLSIVMALYIFIRFKNKQILTFVSVKETN